MLIIVYFYIIVHVVTLIFILSVDGSDGNLNVRAFIILTYFIFLVGYNLNKMNVFRLSFILCFLQETPFNIRLNNHRSNLENPHPKNHIGMQAFPGKKIITLIKIENSLL